MGNLYFLDYFQIYIAGKHRSLGVAHLRVTSQPETKVGIATFITKPQFKGRRS